MYEQEYLVLKRAKQSILKWFGHKEKMDRRRRRRRLTEKYSEMKERRKDERENLKDGLKEIEEIEIDVKKCAAENSGKFSNKKLTRDVQNMCKVGKGQTIILS